MYFDFEILWKLAKKVDFRKCLDPIWDLVLNRVSKFVISEFRDTLLVPKITKCRDLLYNITSFMKAPGLSQRRSFSRSLMHIVSILKRTRVMTSSLCYVRSIVLMYYGNTGCWVSKWGIQNQKEFYLKIHIHCKYISECYRYSIGILPIYQQIL